jgi:hypothetical protein
VGKGTTDPRRKTFLISTQLDNYAKQATTTLQQTMAVTNVEDLYTPYKKLVYIEGTGALCHPTKCHFPECHPTECHFPECHPSECHLD